MQSDCRALRPDITGLRALLVLAVVSFHFEITGFVGGFAGVDIAFVVSGFLMTGIVVTGLERKHFSQLSFYRGRVRRIMLAFVGLCVALLCLGR
jgi:peptidoglycan/LPS O-acetylase OafA/YrhL